MSFYLEKFYNDIKDPSWPAVCNYRDFVKLPKHIRQEIIEQHQGSQRLTQIEDIDYCTDINTYGYQYKNLVYVPVPKCAQTYYIDLFENKLGWKKIHRFSTLEEDTVFFGLIMDPLTRWLKGMTEWLYTSKASDKLVDYLFCDKTSLLFAPDHHTVSYSLLLGKYTEKINWIPLDIVEDTEVKQAMMSLFQKHGHNIKLPLDDQRIHESGPDKLKLFQKIQNYHNQNSINQSDYIFLLQALHAADYKLYRRVAEQFLLSS